MTVFSLLKDASPRITYAIERGAATINDSLCSDLDIAVGKKDFLELFELAQRENMIIFPALSFGGARLFVSNQESGIKRIDFQWKAYYRGIPIVDIGKLLKSRTTDPVTGLFVLPETAHANIINAVKNAYGGADRYRDLLSKHGYRVMGGGERLRWLVGRALSHPVSSLHGLAGTILVYLGRLVYPSGLMIYGADLTMLRGSMVLDYLFQGRVREATMGPAFIRSRILSELCVVSHKAMADVDVSPCADIRAVEQKVVSFLRRKRSGLPWLLAKIA